MDREAIYLNYRTVYGFQMKLNGSLTQKIETKNPRESFLPVLPPSLTLCISFKINSQKPQTKIIMKTCRVVFCFLSS